MPTVPPILFEDDCLVVFDKPSGLLSVPGIGPQKRDSLATRAADAVSGARIVHRLDRDTSGVILMARDAETHRELSRQFQDREVEKKYIAVVAGAVVGTDGIINAKLRKDMDNPPRHLVDSVQGKPSTTAWRVLDRAEDPSRTVLEFTPTTGRTRQLRIHSCVLGHPILGDDLYAPRELVNAADRLLLHATELTITHPTHKERLTFKSPPPFPHQFQDSLD